MKWDLADANSRLSEVLTRAAAEGPQTIDRQGEEFVLLPAAEYERLSRQRPTLKDWLLNGPGLDGVDLRRGRSAMREVEW